MDGLVPGVTVFLPDSMRLGRRPVSVENGIPDGGPLGPVTLSKHTCVPAHRMNG